MIKITDLNNRALRVLGGFLQAASLIGADNSTPGPKQLRARRVIVWLTSGVDVDVRYVEKLRQHHRALRFSGTGCTLHAITNGLMIGSRKTLHLQPIYQLTKSLGLLSGLALNGSSRRPEVQDLCSSTRCSSLPVWPCSRSAHDRGVHGPAT